MKSKKLPYLGIMSIAAFGSIICGSMINGDEGETKLWVGLFAFGAVAILFLVLSLLTPKSH